MFYIQFTIKNNDTTRAARLGWLAEQKHMCLDLFLQCVSGSRTSQDSSSLFSFCFILSRAIFKTVVLKGIKFPYVKYGNEWSMKEVGNYCGPMFYNLIE